MEPIEKTKMSRQDFDEFYEIIEENHIQTEIINALPKDKVEIKDEKQEKQFLTEEEEKLDDILHALYPQEEQ